MIYADPGATETATLDQAPTGLAGTLKFKVLDSTGAVALAETTVGISEIDTGIYAKTFTVPSTKGDYVIVWTNGTTKAAEGLAVGVDAPGTNTPTGGDLVTLAQVREF